MRYHKNICCALILVQPGNKKLTLEAFAEHVFKGLCIHEWQGYSGNQSDAVIFGGHAVGIEVAVGDAHQDGIASIAFQYISNQRLHLAIRII